MKPKTMILLVVAVTCGLGASYMTSRLLAERGSTDEQPKTMVLVAKKNLDIGLQVKNPQDVFQEKGFPPDDVPKNAILNLDQLKGRFLKRSLRPGDWVSQEDLMSDKDGTISYWLAEGYRALGLRVSIDSIAGGFASLPHSRVDIISTVRRGNDKDSYSQVLLENVLVLAVDANTMRDPNGGAMPGNVVTVALKPEDALKLSLAKDYGTLHLMLRKIGDTSHAENDKISFEQVMNRTLGRGELSDGQTWTDPTGQPPMAPNEALPALPKVTEQPKVAETPKVKQVDPVVIEPEAKRQPTLTIIEGSKKQTFVFPEEDDTDANPAVPVPSPEARGNAASRPEAPAADSRKARR